MRKECALGALCTLSKLATHNSVMQSDIKMVARAFEADVDAVWM